MAGGHRAVCGEITVGDKCFMMSVGVRQKCSSRAAVFIVFSQLCCQAEQYNSSYKPAHSPVPAGLGTLVTGDD